MVVWAEKSPVTLEASHEHSSESFPNYKLSDNVTLIGLDGREIEAPTIDDGLGLPNMLES